MQFSRRDDDIVPIMHVRHEQIMEVLKELEPFKQEWERLEKQENDESAEYNRKTKNLPRSINQGLAKLFKKPDYALAGPSNSSQLTIRPMSSGRAEDQPAQYQQDNQPSTSNNTPSSRSRVMQKISASLKNLASKLKSPDKAARKEMDHQLLVEEIMRTREQGSLANEAILRQFQILAGGPGGEITGSSTGEAVQLVPRDIGRDGFHEPVVAESAREPVLSYFYVKPTVCC